MPSPSLRNLQVFEAAARTENFRAAADALFLTHGAVSRQVRALEAELGVNLFERIGRGVVLTAAGKTLQSAVAQAMLLINNATEALAATVENPAGSLTVTVLPSFAARWLLPRMVEFQAQYPDISIDIVATASVLDLNKEGIDLAVRYGKGRWDGLTTQHLADEWLFPVASPSGIRGYKNLPSSARDVASYPLLDPGKDWQRWFRRAGVLTALPQTGMSFNDASLMLQAAESGQGIALGRQMLVTDALATGHLVRLPGPRIRSQYAYFLARAANKPASAASRAFSEWITGSASQMSAIAKNASDTSVKV